MLFNPLENCSPHTDIKLWPVSEIFTYFSPSPKAVERNMFLVIECQKWLGGFQMNEMKAEHTVNLI